MQVTLALYLISLLLTKKGTEMLLCDKDQIAILNIVA